MGIALQFADSVLHAIPLGKQESATTLVIGWEILEGNSPEPNANARARPRSIDEIEKVGRAFEAAVRTENDVAARVVPQQRNRSA
jgi:hypothetical protein